ncbi:hypothetical protein ACFSR9_12475 [Deinococcus taklimakanensis]|uniref:Transposase n=1 Tax=Deinococcus taklimakanensis TaxID=536443 RepID=A0ABW5P4Y0_9DEIO
MTFQPGRPLPNDSTATQELTLYYDFKLSPGYVRAQFCAERMEKIRF